MTVPHILYAEIPGLSETQARQLAMQSVRLVRRHSPKLSGSAARGIMAYWRTGRFGVRWQADYLWYQEVGTNPFTMRSLAGKVIPMWLDDPTGKIKQENPKAKTRYMSGRRQTLIFRTAAPMGSRKTVRTRSAGGRVVERQVPRSYPGAPGRIHRREMATGRIFTSPLRPHVGVRWRNPGIVGREFIHDSLTQVAVDHGLPEPKIMASYRR